MSDAPQAVPTADAEPERDPPPVGLHPCRYEITGDLTVLTPLHIGTGGIDDTVLDPPARDGKSGSNAAPGLTTVTRDALNRPYLPGSTVKNLLRRLTETRTAADALLGTVRTSHQGQRTGGRLAQLFVRGAGLIDAPATDAATLKQHAPYHAKLDGKERPAAFVAARTRINQETGTAAEHKLFFQETVPAGARFRLSLLVVGDTDKQAQDAFDQLKTVLARLAETGGQIGKGQSDGQGRVRLDPDSLRAERISIVRKDGTLQRAFVACALPAAPPGPAPGAGVALRRWHLRLHCPGPFLVVDGSHRPVEVREGDQPHDRHDPRLAQLKAQRIVADKPLVLGSSVMGALRSRAAWLWAVADVDDGTRRDDPDQVCRSLAGATKLTALQRLFGVTGFRGLLGLEDLTVATATPWSITSVKLDRFSGAPIDGALFASACFVAVTLDLRLVLADRRTDPDDPKTAPAGPTKDDIALAEQLMEDLTGNGLMLGHGTNKGFGWFTVTEGPNHG